jgi:hypothetical protein
MGDKSPKAKRRDDKQKSAVEEEGKRLTRTTVAGGTACWFAADDGAFESSGLLYRLHTLRRVVRWRVDERGDLVGVQFFGRKWDEKPTKLRLARRGIEPPIRSAIILTSGSGTTMRLTRRQSCS